MTVPGTASGSSGPRLQAGLQLGDYVLGQPLWPLRIADAYRANGPTGPATVYVIHAAIASNAQVRDQVIAGTRVAAAVPEHKHLVRTLAAGLTGDILWIATEDIDGQLVRDMLVKKRQAGAAGFGVRGTANLIAGVSAGLAEVTHGALAAESVVVNRAGRVRVVDLALGPGTAAAAAAKLITQVGGIAPEVLAGGAPSGAGDVFSTGALMYEALVGSPLERGGPRPSDVVQGMTKQIDDVVARACHQNSEKRFGRVDVLGEVVAEALGKGGAAVEGRVTSGPIPVPEPGAGQSLAMSIATAAEEPSAAGSGNAVVDRALAAALADTNEKWLISKGRLDYGPFSLADVVAQIDKGQIVSGNLIMDKDTGARVDVGEHPLLGPVVDAARQRIDDQRRAQAEVAVQSAEKKRGAALYGVIFAAVAGVAVAGYFIVQSMRDDKSKTKVAQIEGLDGAKIDGIHASLPKAPPKRSGGGHGGGGRNWGPGNANENLSLDLSDDSDETETLGMDKVYAVYSHYGAQLGGCLAGNGGQANISIIIDGPSGRVNFVKVNGQATGPLWGCLNRVLRSMQFPTIHGPRTRAEFDIGL